MLGLLRTRLAASLFFTLFLVSGSASVCLAAFAVKPIPVRVDQFQIANVVPVNEDGIPTNKAKVSRKDVEKLVTVFRGVNEIVKPLRIPESVRLEMSEIEFNPRADAMNNVIYMGVRFGAKDKNGKVYTQHPGVMIPVAAHEYGHLVFTQNVLSEVQLYQVSLGMLGQLAKVAEALQNIQAQMLLLAEKYEQSSPEVQQRIVVQLEELKQQAIRLVELGLQLKNQLDPLFTWVRDATSPYNEFFADIIAVLYTENSESVFKAVQITMPPEDPDLDRRRRNDVDARSFKGAGLVHVHGKTPHSVFKPAREFIWKKYLQRPTFLRNHKTAVATTLVRVMTSELVWLQEHPEVNPTRDQVLVNKRLIKLMDAELSRIQ